MPGFDLGGAVNGTAEWACSAPIIRTVISNPVFTALLITALAAIVVMSLYHYQIKRAGTKRATRALLYVFFIVTAVMFVHHYATMRIARDSTAQKGVRDVFSSIQQSRSIGVSSAVPVYPMGFEGVEVTGGAPHADDCGCAVAGGARPDNVAMSDGLLTANDGLLDIKDGLLDIKDVTLPAAASPFGAK